MNRIRRFALDMRGEGSRGAMVAIVLLVIALLVVVFAWQRDADAVDPELDVDIGSAPAAVAHYV